MITPDEYIDNVEHLPPAPTVATNLLGLFGDPDRDIDRIVDLISHDPALTVEVLKRCNSALFVGAEPASTMFEAVTRLGMYEVFCVTVALVSSRTMAMLSSADGLDARVLWRHSVTTAVAVAALADHIGETEAAAFTAGLLHDVGKIVFSSVEGPRYTELIRRSGGGGPALVEAEEAVLGFTHAALGARLLFRWGLPANVALATLHHHQSPSLAAPFERMAAAVKFANGLAHQIEDGTAQESGALPCDPETMEILQLTAADVPSALDLALAGLERVQGLL